MQYAAKIMATTALLCGILTAKVALAQTLKKNQLEQLSISPPPLSTKATAPPPLQIPLNLSTQNFGFFCRQELKMQKAHIPVSFRVGTMEQCNWLEQKPGYR